MDRTAPIKPPPGQPVIAHANWFQFGAAESITNECVESRMFLWCHSGRGQIRVNGRWLALAPGEWVFLPWRHEIVYAADAQQPFFVGGIHVLPHHDPARPVVFQVAHRAGEELAEVPWRRDVAWPALAGIVRGNFDRSGALRLLAEYIVESYRPPTPPEEPMRMLARLFLGELARAVAVRPEPEQAMPSQMRRMQEYVLVHLDQKISVHQLARIGNCSKASVHRLFRTFCGQAPNRWIAQQRVRKAQQLLRSTMLRVKEVGEQVGLPDQFHFSRFFKQHTGFAPSEYQQQRRFI